MSESSLRSISVFRYVLLLLTQADGTWRYVEECPKSQCDWLKRAEILLCDRAAGVKYHCLRDSNDQLLETCLVPKSIPPAREGCPWVDIYIDNKTYFPSSLESKLSHCPRNNSRCPPWNHTGYRTDELLKYTGCFLSLTDRFSEEIETTTEVTSVKGLPPEKDPLYSCYAVEVGVVSALIAGIIGVVLGKYYSRYYWCISYFINRRRKSKGQRESRKAEEETAPKQQV